MTIVMEKYVKKVREREREMLVYARPRSMGERENERLVGS